MNLVKEIRYWKKYGSFATPRDWTRFFLWSSESKTWTHQLSPLKPGSIETICLSCWQSLYTTASLPRFFFQKVMAVAWPPALGVVKKHGSAVLPSDQKRHGRVHGQLRIATFVALNQKIKSVQIHQGIKNWLQQEDCG